MHHISIDIETFSSVDIRKSGMYKYVQSPDFQILLFAYSINGGPVYIIDLAQGQELSNDLVTCLGDPNWVKHAYNAPFEFYALSKFYNTRVDQWRCTMLHGLYCGYTAGLAATAVALGLPDDKRKLSIGSSLIKLFCVPQKPTAKNGQKTRILPHHEPEKWQLFKDYCVQDVVTEMEIERRMSNFPVPDCEQALWVLDQQINACGVAVDTGLIAGAIECSDVTTHTLLTEAIELSGLDNPKSVKQLSKWLEEETGEEVTDLTKANVKDMINASDDGAAKRVLEIRQELSKTSVKKYAAMDAAVCNDGRVRGLLQFYGANRTGRWAGRLVQVQNLPRNYLGTLDIARRLVKDKNVTGVRLLYGNVPDTLSQLVRTAFIPSPGNTFLVADFSAIEARVIAWLADEKWRLDVFATHGKIYEASASQMFGVPIELIVKDRPEYELRQKGKVAELALGYQGAAGALITMGALKGGLTEEELPEIVRRWRAASKRIVDLWYTVENAVIETMRTGQPVGINKGIIISRQMDIKNDQDFLTIRLPSGRELFYAKPFLAPGKFGKEQVCYKGINQQTKKWEDVPSYGGKFVENIVQAIARDCLAVSLQRLAAAGYQTVMHIHDESVMDVPIQYADLKAVCNLMGQSIPWAPGLLLRADGYQTEFYKKD